MANATRARPFTASDIDRLLAPKARPDRGQTITAVMGGLDLCVGSTGPGRWRYRYRPRGMDPGTGKQLPQRSMTLGSTATHTLRHAFAAAAALKLRVSNGEDPAIADRAAAMAERSAVLAAERQAVLDDAARVTCRKKLHEYASLLASRGRSLKHQREEVAQVRLGLDSVGLLDVSPNEITPGHVEKMVSLCPAGSRVPRFGALDRFLRWTCRGRGIMAPTAIFDRHERPAPVARRQRVLSPNEVGAVWTAAGDLQEGVLRDLVRFRDPARHQPLFARHPWPLPAARQARAYR